MSKTKTLLDVYETMDADQKLVVEYLVGRLAEETEPADELEQSGSTAFETFLAHQGVDVDTTADTFDAVYGTMNAEQKKALHFAVTKALEVD